MQVEEDVISPSDSHMRAAADAEAVSVNEGFIPAGTRKSERHCCTSKKRDKAEVMSSRCDITQMHITGYDASVWVLALPYASFFTSTSNGKQEQTVTISANSTKTSTSLS